MRIVLDVMGGDNAPQAIIEGGLKAIENNPELYLILVGKSDIINQELNTHEYSQQKLEIVEAAETIGMNESPVKALRKKKNSTLNIATNLLKSKEADGFVSAGNTGAVMAASLFNIGRIPGIKRPSIATAFPTETGQTLLLDAGANVDSKPQNLRQFAIMGQIYLSHVLGNDNPRLGLLSIGEEKKKGNQLSKDTYELLETDERILNFAGNVEGRDIFNGSCDLVVCDGFVGNVVLKTTEGVASLMFKILKKTLQKNIITKMGALLIKPYLNHFMKQVDYRQYGGAPLLGVNEVVIISHGSSDATAIKNAIEVAHQTAVAGITDRIEDEIKKDGDFNDS